ncbi:MAG: hypothetical protein ABSG53_12155 [Thermoguttaceae bacterium]|jgi:hypothetical protein
MLCVSESHGAVGQIGSLGYSLQGKAVTSFDARQKRDHEFRPRLELTKFEHQRQSESV